MVGFGFDEVMAGPVTWGATAPKVGANTGRVFEIHASVQIDDLDRFVADPQHSGSLSGWFEGNGISGRAEFHGGKFNLFSPTDDPDTRHMIYEGAFKKDGADFYFAGRKEVRADSGLDLWSDTTTLYSTIHQGSDSQGAIAAAGILTLGVRDLLSLVSTINVQGADSLADKATAISKFGGFFMGELWERYGPG